MTSIFKLLIFSRTLKGNIFVPVYELGNQRPRVSLPCQSHVAS